MLTRAGLGGAACCVLFSLFSAPALRAASLQPSTPYVLSELAADVAAVMQTAQGDQATMRALAKLLTRFLEEGVLEDTFQHPHPGLDATTYLLSVAPDKSFSIASLVLRAGASTPIHDHQTWSVWGTYMGQEKETRFERSAHSAHVFPELRAVSSRVLPDEGVSLIPRPPRDVHTVENIGGTVSVSIHIHGTDISTQTRNRYDTRKKVVVPFVQSYERRYERSD